MLGNQVEVYLQTPEKTVYGELRRQSAEGVWVYVGSTAMDARVIFYPQHRILEIKDCGRTYR